MKITITVLLAFLFYACAEKPVDKGGTESSPVNMSYRDSLTKGLYGIEGITFGKFCGMCGKGCATMYSFGMKGNTNVLCEDTADRYFKDSIRCDVIINNRDMMRLAGEVYQHIPASFVHAQEPATTFGCPDCTDGCGLYLELRMERNQRRKFRIDTNVEALKGDVKPFAVYLDSAVHRMTVLDKK